MYMISAEAYFGGLTLAGKELTAAEKRGGPLPPKFDFGVKEVCASCKENVMPPKKILRCSACKAVIYCSMNCAKRDWSYPSVPNAPTHKMLCPDNKRHMLRLPDTQAITKSFPWGRIETDGSFNFDVARGRFGVLGASGYGYWSHRGGPIPHQEEGRMAAALGNSPYARQLLSVVQSFDHLDGKDLLGKKHLSDKDGWKLPTALIPYLNFSSAATRPKVVTGFEEPVVDWDSWYRWRKLKKDSPAALLLAFPMSVYQLVVHCLEVTSSKAGQANKRIPLHIHLVGAEIELNYLPLSFVNEVIQSHHPSLRFSELALLLPYHDIKLVFFGNCVSKLLAEAKRHPGCVASKSPVYTYKSPPECGAGALDIFLHSGSANWSSSGSDSALTAHGGIPDAIVACNAGLSSYPEWMPVTQAAHMRRIPFAVTEYTEQSLESQRGSMSLILRGSGVPLRPLNQYEIKLNPFQRPGQRGIPMYRLPNVVNGFTMVVYKHEKAKGEDSKADDAGMQEKLDNMSLEELD
ncbi:hypothetical protein DXG03_001104 [Asterophora parasitica]|uniref:MYND-type domain-containing protein n=1 Tax=Asterophora parasitica TaxID=117018 RepID=A0A9P7GCM8_9AGAR|nr:hypothetical protein DXG03_001104 [Asterophora parasitica]